MEGFVVVWWMWVLCGLLLLLAEFLTPGAFYQFFFGLGAIAVGIIDTVGLDLSFQVQVILFLVLSIGMLVVLRKPLRVKFSTGPDEKVDEYEGETAVAMEDIPVNGIGKVELRGAAWNARNVGDLPVAESQRCSVVRVQGLTIDIKT